MLPYIAYIRILWELILGNWDPKWGDFIHILILFFDQDLCPNSALNGSTGSSRSAAALEAMVVAELGPNIGGFK